MFGAGIKLMEDDDEFFGNLDNSQSNLSNLFENSQNKAKLDHSLKYVPPQKPNPTDHNRKHDKNSGWNVEIAKVVTAFKLVNDENIAQGRVGLAVLKSPEGLQKIILYRAQNNILSTISLTGDVQIYIKDSYLQFTDDVKIFWSILCENNEHKIILDLIQHNVVIIESKEKLTLEKQENTTNSTSNNYPTINTNEEDYSTKDKILTRISKMGQALPTLNNSNALHDQQTTDLSDSSDNEYKTRIPYSKPCILSRKPSNNKVQHQIMTLSTTTIPNNSQLMSARSAGGSIMPFNTQIVQPETQYLNMLLSENRTQNIEVRMNITKLETKIEKVLDKIDLIQHKTTDNSKDLEDEILSLEEKVLELKKENRNLRQQQNLVAVSTPVSLPNHLAVLPPAVDSIDDKDLIEFGQIITSLGLDVKNYKNSIDLCRDIIRNSNAKQSTLQKTLEIQEKNFTDMKNQLEIQEKAKGQLVSDLNQQIEHLETKIINLETLTETLRKDKENLFEKLENADKTVDEMVKMIMNTLYTNLVSKLEERQYSTNEVLKLCANEIKNQTKNALLDRKKS